MPTKLYREIITEHHKLLIYIYILGMIKDLGKDQQALLLSTYKKDSRGTPIEVYILIY